MGPNQTNKLPLNHLGVFRHLSMVQTGAGFRNSAISSVLATCTFSSSHQYNRMLVHKSVMAGALLLYVSYELSILSMCGWGLPLTVKGVG